MQLAPDYVREYVELGYATTTARAQGATVDITRTVVTPAMAREDLYVAVTRGRERNQLYVPTEPLDPDCPPGTPAPQSADEILRAVLATNRMKHHPSKERAGPPPCTSAPPCWSSIACTVS